MTLVAMGLSAPTPNTQPHPPRLSLATKYIALVAMGRQLAVLCQARVIHEHILLLPYVGHQRSTPKTSNAITHTHTCARAAPLLSLGIVVLVSVLDVAVEVSVVVCGVVLLVLLVTLKVVWVAVAVVVTVLVSLTLVSLTLVSVAVMLLVPVVVCSVELLVSLTLVAVVVLVGGGMRRSLQRPVSLPAMPA